MRSNFSDILCFECDSSATELHHVVPRVLGGRRAVPLCGDCHGKIHGLHSRGGFGKLVKEGQRKAVKRGVKLGPPIRITPEQVAQINKLRMEGVLIRDIAKIVGVSVGYVHKITKKAGISNMAKVVHKLPRSRLSKTVRKNIIDPPMSKNQSNET